MSTSEMPTAIASSTEDGSPATSSMPTTQPVRGTEDVEVKWFFHRAGQQREQWVTGETATTLCTLIRAEFRVHLSTGTYKVAREGDFVMCAPSINHLWQADQESLVLSIRWPSRPSARQPAAAAHRSKQGS